MGELRGFPAGDTPNSGQPAFEGPALFLRGGDSDYVLPEHDEAIRARFPRARRITVEDAGHWVHAERPDDVRAAIETFLDER